MYLRELFCRPYGLGSSFAGLTQDLRPGLSYVAPPGLARDGSNMSISRGTRVRRSGTLPLTGAGPPSLLIFLDAILNEVCLPVLYAPTPRLLLRNLT